MTRQSKVGNLIEAEHVRGKSDQKNYATLITLFTFSRPEEQNPKEPKYSLSLSLSRSKFLYLSLSLSYDTSVCDSPVISR